MLTPQQLQNIKVMTSPQGMASKVMTPEEAKASFSATQNTPIEKPSTNLGIGIGTGIAPIDLGSDIVNSAKEGVNKFGQGFKQTQEATKTGDIATMGRGVLNELGGGLETVFSPITGALKTASHLPLVYQTLDAVKKYVIDPTANAISDNPKLQEFMTKNPHADEIASNLMTIVLSMAGVKASPEIKSVVASTAENVANKVSDVTSKVATKVEKMVTKTPEQIALENAQNLESPTSANIMNRVARLNPTDATKFEKLSGMTHGDYLAKSGNFGTPDTIIKNEAVKFVDSIKSVDTEMAKLPGIYESAPLKTMADELVARENRVSSTGAPSPDLARVTELKSKLNNGGLNMTEINDLKRIYERNVKLDFARQNLPEQTARASNIDTAVRNWQFKEAKDLGFTNVDELNKQTQISKFIIDKLGEQVIGKTGNDAVSLTDWILLAGGEPSSVGAFLTKKFFSSKAVQAKIADIMANEPSIIQIKPKTSITPENINRQVNPKGNLALPEGKSKTIENKVPINLKGESTVESPATLSKKTTVNPKTGTQYVRNLKTGKMEIINKPTSSKPLSQPQLEKVKSTSPKSTTSTKKVK